MENAFDNDSWYDPETGEYVDMYDDSVIAYSGGYYDDDEDYEYEYGYEDYDYGYEDDYDDEYPSNDLPIPEY